jgi:hypothetical protein
MYMKVYKTQFSVRFLGIDTLPVRNGAEITEEAYPYQQISTQSQCRGHVVYCVYFVQKCFPLLLLLLQSTIERIIFSEPPTVKSSKFPLSSPGGISVQIYWSPPERTDPKPIISICCWLFSFCGRKLLLKIGVLLRIPGKWASGRGNKPRGIISTMHFQYWRTLYSLYL